LLLGLWLWCFNGGVADLVSKPRNIKVIIRDYDNETKESEFLEAVFDKS
jgi:hypothetical protein